MKTKQELIDIIEGLYPVDSACPEVNDVGKHLLLQAMEEVGFNWRELPKKVLNRYAFLCLEKEENNFRFNFD